MLLPGLLLYQNTFGSAGFCYVKSQPNCLLLKYDNSLYTGEPLRNWQIHIIGLHVVAPEVAGYARFHRRESPSVSFWKPQANRMPAGKAISARTQFSKGSS